MKNKEEVKKFLGVEVRVINGEYIVIQDIFLALDRLSDKGQIQSTDRNKLSRFLEDINRKSDSKIFTITSKGKKQSRTEQELECLRLDAIPIVLTQFKPNEKINKETNELLNKDKINKWKQFMIFVDDILSSLDLYRYIIVDKESQKSHIEKIEDNGGKAIITNQQVNIIMAKLVGVYDQGIKSLKKDELKIYQSQTIIDLLEVREFVLEKFTNAFEFTCSHKESAEMAYKLAKRKFNIE